jgi:hypothetical protein
MKRNKHGKKTNKRRQFRKNISKKYKKTRIGGAIDWAVPVPKSPGKTPKQPTPKSPTQSLKELLSRVDNQQPRPLFENPIVQSYKSKKSSGKKPTSPSKVSDIDQYSIASSVSHVQEEYDQPKQPRVYTPTAYDINEVITSYRLSSGDSGDTSERDGNNVHLYNPPHINYVPSGSVTEMLTPSGSMAQMPVYYATNYGNLNTSNPRGLTVKHGSIKDLSAEEKEKLDLFEMYSPGYSYLEPKLYKIMSGMKIHKLYGTALIWGNLNDELIEFIGLSSERAIESRLLYKNKTVVRKFIEKCKNFYTSLVDSVSGVKETRPYNYDVGSLKVARPGGLQDIGYNTHNFFRPTQITESMYEKGMNNSEDKKKEYVFMHGHGGLGEELSQNKKILAKKYIRLIELGSMFELASATTRNIFKYINDLMRSEDYPKLFLNNTVGKTERKKVFSELCKYYSINDVNACKVKDTLKLVDITHDRVFSGHFTDAETDENQKVTFRNIDKVKTMGMFIPVDYNQDTSDKFLYNKEMFRLYPGSSYLTLSTSVNLIDTLLPIAINENIIFNVLVFSCAVRYADEQLPVKLLPPPQAPSIYTKEQGIPAPPSSLANKGKETKEMEVLHSGKMFISDLSRLISEFIIATSGLDFYVEMSDVYGNYTVRSKYPASKMVSVHIQQLTKGIVELVNLYNKKLTFINKYNIMQITSIFSFNRIGLTDNMFYLIDPANPDINDKLNTELIYIKLYLMKELYDKCYKHIMYYKILLEGLIYVFREVYQTTSDAQYKSYLDTYQVAIDSLYGIFGALYPLLQFINNGLKKPENGGGTGSFYNYPKFVTSVEEYKKKHMKKLYDRLFPHMDYNSYEAVLKRLPHGWIELHDPNQDKVYYANTITNEVQWKRPVIPNKWYESIDASTGLPYYTNFETGQTLQTLPGKDDNYKDEDYYIKRSKTHMYPGQHRKHRAYIYKYDEMDNIDNVIKRREMTRKKMAKKPDMLSAARNITRSVRRREREANLKRAEAEEDPNVKKMYLMNRVESKLESDKNKYHVTA